MMKDFLECVFILLSIESGNKFELINVGIYIVIRLLDSCLLIVGRNIFFVPGVTESGLITPNLIIGLVNQVGLCGLFWEMKANGWVWR